LGAAALAALAAAGGGCASPPPEETPTPESERALAEARALEADGRSEGALQAYEAVLGVQPGLTAARIRAADLARRVGDDERAARHARRALERPGADPAELCTVVRALAAADPKRAGKALQPLIAAEPDRADAQLAAAEIALARNDRSAAASHLRRALGAAPGPAELLDVGRAFSRAGFHPDALECVRRALDEGDRSPEARYTLGWALERAERYDECAREYSALIEDHPDYLPAYRNLGALMARDGELPRAVRLWERGLQAHPGDEGLRANIDQALEALGLTREEMVE
jgi:tetratricopeptide (TPR) repeat protein